MSIRIAVLEKRAVAVGWADVQEYVGVAMNPVDHPMGGGEGRTSGGGQPQSPWGQLSKDSQHVKSPIRPILKSWFVAMVVS